MPEAPLNTAPKSKPILWTIAASDSGGGAGIQADLKTFFDLGGHGCSVITALTAQNTQAVSHIEACSVESFSQQFDALACDLPPAAIKIGVIPNGEILELLIVKIAQLKKTCGNQRPFIVFDPVLGASSGGNFSAADMSKKFTSLYPLLDLITPNIPEAKTLSGQKIENPQDIIAAAQTLQQQGAKAVLIKGGHGEDNNLSQDFYSSQQQQFWMSHPRQANNNSHGSGCTLASAIASFVAQGKPIQDALVLSHAYIQQAIRLAQPLTVRPDSGAVVQAGWPLNFDDYPQISASAEQINLPAFAPCDSLALGLYPVVDSVEWLEKLLPLGIETIQLRVKNIPAEQLDKMIEQAAELGRQYQARLFINDHWQLAIKHKAYGVHLGQEDLDTADLAAIREAGLRLGLSTHSEYEWARAATFKPSYLALGAVFPTDTKAAIVIGEENLGRWAQTLRDHYPLVAIGGIKQHHFPQILATGVGSIALVTAITQAEDYRGATKKLLRAIQEREK